MSDGSGALTIGALSAATGIPVETIRTWERRYGFPVADRKPSGHRLYDVATVPRLRLINQALARGHRAAEVVPASEAALEALLEAIPQPPAAPVRRAHPSSGILDPGELFGAVRAFDGEALKQSFQAEWARRGPLQFLEQVAAPFLTGLGQAWAAGELDVRHEHFASATLGDFLRTLRMPHDDRANGPLVAVATLPGERHGLGLQMTALLFAMAGWRVLLLGIETPAEQIVALAREAPLSAVALSFVMPSNDGAAVRALRRKLPREVQLLAGGAAASESWRARGLEVLPDLSALDGWLRQRGVGFSAS